MMEYGPTYGTMTWGPLSRFPSDVPVTQTSSNASLPSLPTTGNGDLSPMTLSNPSNDSLDASTVLSPRLLNSQTRYPTYTESDVLALSATTLTGTEKSIVQTLSELPKLFVAEQHSDKSHSISRGNIFYIPVESKHIPEFCLAGETRMKLQLCIGFADPRVPAKVVKRMNSLMTEKENLPTSKVQNISGGMDTMEYPM